MSRLLLSDFEGHIIKVLSGIDPDAYIVGGFLRDAFLRPGHKRKDLDLVCREPLKLARAFSREKQMPFVVLDPERHIYRVIASADFFIDFAPLRGNNIGKDLRERDFTLNAIAMHLKTRRLIDPLKGLEAIARHKLLLCSDSSFQDDPLRILRAYSIAADCNLNWGKGLKKMLLLSLNGIEDVAKERVNNELKRLFSSQLSYKWFLKAYKDGLFKYLFPEALSMQDMCQGPYHHLDVLMHSFESLKFGESLLKNVKYITRINNRGFLLNYLDGQIGCWPRYALLKWVIFWHDIGKPLSRRKRKDKIVFYGHNKTGAKQISVIMRRLKFSYKQINWAKMLIDMHLRPGDITKAGNPKPFYRMVRQCEGEDLAVLLLSWADARATRGVKNPFVNFTRHRKKLIELINLSIEIKTRPRMPKLITGDDVMRIAGIGPSKEVGHILDKVKELQLAGKIKDRRQALEFVRKGFVAQ